MAFLSKFVLTLAIAIFVAPARADVRLPLLTKKTYTPLLFFKLPPGSSPHCKFSPHLKTLYRTSTPTLS